MPETQLVAKSLQEIVNDPILLRTINGRQRVDDAIEEALALWHKNIYRKHRERHPSSAFTTDERGRQVYQGTDYDLFTLLTSLSQNHKVINIPHYKPMRARSGQSNRRVIANENRHGQVLRLVSNKKSHSFSVMIMDFNVEETTKRGKAKVGVPRNFAVVDDYGKLYTGWSSLDWNESPEERSFIEQHKLEAFRGVIQFGYFVVPSLVYSFYSRQYLKFKILDDIREQEVKFYQGLGEKMRAKGARLGPREKKVYWKEGPEMPIKVENLEAKVKHKFTKQRFPIYGIEESNGKKPKLKLYAGEPTSMEAMKEVLRFCLRYVKKLTYISGPMARVPTRATEIAMFHYGFKEREDREPGAEQMPRWVSVPWEQNYKESPKSRIKWNRLKISDDVQLLYRIAKRTARIRTQEMPMSYLLNNPN